MKKIDPRLGKWLAVSIQRGALKAGVIPCHLISEPSSQATAIRVQTETKAEFVIPIHRIIEEGLKWYVTNRIPKAAEAKRSEQQPSATENIRPASRSKRKTRLKIVPSQEKLP